MTSYHLFFSYAHADAARMFPIHARMLLVTEHNIWIDKIGIERGEAWENAIYRAVTTSYGVIFAVTKTFLERPFILEKEIPWAHEKFKNLQGAQLFVLLFDGLTEADLPPALRTPHITEIITFDESDAKPVYLTLKQRFPQPRGTATHPFIVDWPRLTNFYGRDAALLDLHEKLRGDGRVGVKSAGLHGMGGLGKTQLAVEYAHRYRFNYPGGVFWINAGADWRKEFADCAKRIGLTAPFGEDADERLILQFETKLKEDDEDTLIILDNVEDPMQVERIQIAPKLTVGELCRLTRTRLLITSRVKTMPSSFKTVPVDVLESTDALAVLSEAWSTGRRKDDCDNDTLADIAERLGYLPLALGWMAAALATQTDLQPAVLLRELNKRGLDDLVEELRQADVDLGTPVHHDLLISVALGWQIDRLASDSARKLLALASAYGETAVVPVERLRLVAEVHDGGITDPFEIALSRLQNYNLVERLSEGTAVRLHPLTQAYVKVQFNGASVLAEAVPTLLKKLRFPEILDRQINTRGFAAVHDDLTSTQAVLASPFPELVAFVRLVTLCEPHLRYPPRGAQRAYEIQQLRHRAYHEGDEALSLACDEFLASKRHFVDYCKVRRPQSSHLLRVMSGHRGVVTDAVELSDGRILSQSDDGTLRLWSTIGTPIATLDGHTGGVRKVRELSDGCILSWDINATLRLWSPDGALIATFEGHTDSVRGATELSDGRILSWSTDGTLELWSASGAPIAILDRPTDSIEGLSDRRWFIGSHNGTLEVRSYEGTLIATLEGHIGAVEGATILADGRILSWSRDGTLRLWLAHGPPITTLEGHTKQVRGVTNLSDGRILSWSDDRTVRLWSADGAPIATFEGYTERVGGVTNLSDGRILSWSDDRTLRLWSPDGAPIATFEGHTKRVRGAAVLSDGRILSWSDDRTLRLWSPGGAPIATLTGHTHEIFGATVLSDGRILSWDIDGTLRLWSPDGALIATFEGHTIDVSVRGAAELSDGRILSWSDDCTLRLWSASGAPIATLKGHTKEVWGATVLSDGRILSCSGDGTLRLWSAGGVPIATLEGDTDEIWDATVLSDDHILSRSDDGTVRLWSADGDAIAIFRTDSPIRLLPIVINAAPTVVFGTSAGSLVFLRFHDGA